MGKNCNMIDIGTQSIQAKRFLSHNCSTAFTFASSDIQKREHKNRKGIYWPKAKRKLSDMKAFIKAVRI